MRPDRVPGGRQCEHRTGTATRTGQHLPGVEPRPIAGSPRRGPGPRRRRLVTWRPAERTGEGRLVPDSHRPNLVARGEARCDLTQAPSWYDSESGSRFVEIMLSALATCHQQGINVLDDLTLCCRACLAGGPVHLLIPTSTTAQVA